MASPRALGTSFPRQHDTPCSDLDLEVSFGWQRNPLSGCVIFGQNQSRLFHSSTSPDSMGSACFTTDHVHSPSHNRPNSPSTTLSSTETTIDLLLEHLWGEISTEETTEASEETEGEGGERRPKCRIPAAVVISAEDIEHTSQVSLGGMDQLVFPGKYTRGKEEFLIAHKLYNDVPPEYDVAEWKHFECEAIVHCAMSRADPERVAQFHGVTLTKTPSVRIGIVMELCENGSVWGYLKKNPGWRLSRRILVLLDVAKALESIHAYRPIALIHRDLKWQNVGLTGDMTPKLIDCGSGRVEFDSHVQSARRGTEFYMAPEVMRRDRNLTSKVDIFSFGVMMFTLLTGRDPVACWNSESQRRMGIRDRKKIEEELGSESTRLLCELMQQCWEEEPSDRPSSSVVVSKIKIAL